MTERNLVSFDWAMKKLLRDKANFEVLEGFLSELLHFQVKIIEILESESNQENLADKFNKVDVLARTDSEELIIIEVQYDKEADYFQRINYGTSKIVTEYINKGDMYENIKKIYSISIIYFDLGHGKDYIYHGKTEFRGIHEHDKLLLSDKQQAQYGKIEAGDIFPEYYIIKVNDFNDIAKNTLDEWIYFLKNDKVRSNFKAQGLAEAREVLDFCNLSPIEQRKYKRAIEDDRYNRSVMETYKEEGRDEGREEGRAEGRMEGKAEGKKEAQTQIIQQLLASGMNIEQVSLITKMSIEDINNLTK